MCIVSYRLFQNSDRSGKADLGIADAAEGADGDAGRHWSRCCDHACAAWLSWPTRIQLLQTLQRTRPLSYLRASGSATTKGGAASLALEASFSIYETKKKGLRVGQMTHPFLARQLLRWASHGMEQNVEFGRRRIHLSQDAQRTRYASN